MKTLNSKKSHLGIPLKKGQAPSRVEDKHAFPTSRCHKQKRSAFPGPLMSAKMQKDDLIQFIQEQSQNCLLNLDNPDNQKSYFFWLIMELYCNQNGKVKMHEIATILFEGYSKLRHVEKKEDWCLPLAELLCSGLPEDKLKESVVSLGKKFASKGWIYAAHICFVSAGLELKFDARFMLVGTSRVPIVSSEKRELFERTEVYEYVLSLTTGACQINFQGFKCILARVLAEAGLKLKAFEYCKIIATKMLKHPVPISRLERRWLHWVDDICKMLLNQTAVKEPNWLICLRKCLDNNRVNSHNNEQQESDKPPLPLEHSELNSLYTVGNHIGKGGFGSVLAGSRKADGKPVAIKFQMRRGRDVLINIPGENCKLPMEVALLKLMSKYEKVAQLLDYYKTPDFYILVLERPVPCMDNYDFMTKNKGRLSEAMSRRIMSQVVEAVIQCCDRGVLHRDIKNQNILVNPETMEVKLIDFGCGCLLKDEPYKDIGGTPLYWPPEWYISNQYLGVPAAVWSLGIFLYSMVNGLMPFVKSDQIIAGNVQFYANLSQDCRNLIKLCLNPEAEDRPTLKQILEHRWFMEELNT